MAYRDNNSGPEPGLFTQDGFEDDDIINVLPEEHPLLERYSNRQNQFPDGRTKSSFIKRVSTQRVAQVHLLFSVLVDIVEIIVLYRFSRDYIDENENDGFYFNIIVFTTKFATMFTAILPVWKHDRWPAYIPYLMTQTFSCFLLLFAIASTILFKDKIQLYGPYMGLHSYTALLVGLVFWKIIDWFALLAVTEHIFVVAYANMEVSEADEALLMPSGLQGVVDITPVPSGACYTNGYSADRDEIIVTEESTPRITLRDGVIPRRLDEIVYDDGLDFCRNQYIQTMPEEEVAPLIDSFDEGQEV